VVGVGVSTGGMARLERFESRFFDWWAGRVGVIDRGSGFSRTEREYARAAMIAFKIRGA
jgi:hypothetical protein